MQPVEDNNLRYILELERLELLQQQSRFDRSYHGTTAFAFLTSLELFALLAHLCTVGLLVHFRARSRSNAVVALWAALNALVLLEKLQRLARGLLGAPAGDDARRVAEMAAALARSYGTVLSVVWLYAKYFERPRSGLLAAVLIAAPGAIWGFFVWYYFQCNEYVFEVYGPASDIVSVAVYISVGLVFVLCKIFGGYARVNSPYTFLVGLVNLVTNFPVCFVNLYLRFVLDVGWVYRFHIYFVDFVVNVVACSNAFIVLLLVILFNEQVRLNLFRKKVGRDFEG